jgi:hypothetical protein
MYAKIIERKYFPKDVIFLLETMSPITPIA